MPLKVIGGCPLKGGRHRKCGIYRRNVLVMAFTVIILLYLSHVGVLLVIQPQSPLQTLATRLQPMAVLGSFLVSPNRTHTVVSAFFDDRPQGYGPSVRALGYGAYNDTFAMYCKLFYPDGTSVCSNSPVVIESAGSMDPQSPGGMHVSWYICRLNNQELSLGVPTALAFLQNRECGYSDRILKVEWSQEMMTPAQTTNDVIGVCMPYIHGHNATRQDWVEFLELSRILGAGFVQIFNTTRTWRILHDLAPIYIKSGYLKVVNWVSSGTGTGPAFHPLLLSNDCLYRNLHEAKYLVMLAAREMLISHPTTEQRHPLLSRGMQRNGAPLPNRGHSSSSLYTFSWSTLLNDLFSLHNSTLVGAYMFRVVRYFDETSQNTSTYEVQLPDSKSISHKRQYLLPKIVTHRLRELASMPANQPNSVQLVVEPLKVSSISQTGFANMLTGYLYYTVPELRGDIHRFCSRAGIRIKTLHLDSSMDKLVPPLLKAMHQVYYSTES